MYTEFGYIGAIDGIEYSTTHFIHIYFTPNFDVYC